MKQFILFCFFLLVINVDFAQSNIGVVDSQKVLDTMPSRKLGVAEIQIVQKDAILEMTEMDSVLQTYYTELERWRSPCFPIEPIRDSPEHKIRDYTYRMQAREQELDSILIKLTVDLNKRSLEIVNQAIEIVGNRLKLNVVLDKSQTLYSSSDLDITNLVIQEMLKLDVLPK